MLWSAGNESYPSLMKVTPTDGKFDESKMTTKDFGIASYSSGTRILKAFYVYFMCIIFYVL